MFKVQIKLKDVENGEYETFSEAFKRFFQEVKDLLENGTSYQILETTCHIVLGNNILLDFYDSRDLAYRIGLMEEGKIVENPPELTSENEEDIFNTTHKAAATLNSMINKTW